MKKKIAGLALVSALATSAVLALSACGGGKDWSKATLDDYDPAEFMQKEGIVYGFCEDETSRDNVINDFGTPSAYLALYDDGSAAAVGCFYVPGLYENNFDEWECGIQAFEDAQVIAFSWRYWTQDGNTLTINLQGLWLTDYYEDGAPIPDMALEDALRGEWTYEVEVVNNEASIDNYETIAMSSVAILPIHYKGAPEFKSLREFADDLDEKLNGAN